VPCRREDGCYIPRLAFSEISVFGFLVFPPRLICKCVISYNNPLQYWKSLSTPLENYITLYLLHMFFTFHTLHVIIWCASQDDVDILCKNCTNRNKPSFGGVIIITSGPLKYMTAANSCLQLPYIRCHMIIAVCADGRDNPTRELPAEICPHRKSCTQPFIIVQNT